MYVEFPAEQLGTLGAYAGQILNILFKISGHLLFVAISLQNYYFL
jgi:hypothetical protein